MPGASRPLPRPRALVCCVRCVDQRFLPLECGWACAAASHLSLTCEYQASGHQLCELKAVQAHEIVHDDGPEVHGPEEGPDPPRHLLR